jgi:hypothetical protein
MQVRIFIFFIYVDSIFVMSYGFSHLGLVCFKENEFLEFIFLTFPCLATLEKSSQRKLNSSQQKYTLLSKESVFLRIKKGKHFPFHKSRSLSLVKNDWKQQQLQTHSLDN